MKGNLKTLINHLQRAELCGLINEVTLSENLTFAVTDESRGVLAVADAGIGMKIAKTIGVFQLGMFIKMLQYVQTLGGDNPEVDMEIAESKFAVKLGTTKFKWQLSDPNVIASTVKNYEDAMKKVTSEKGIEIDVQNTEVDIILKSIQVIQPESICIYSENGKVFCMVGVETDHNAIIELGKTTSKKEIKVRFGCAIINNVLRSIATEEKVKVELRASMPVIFSVKGYTYVVAPQVEAK